MIIGMGVVAFLAAYMVFNLRTSSERGLDGSENNNKHFLLQLVFLFLFLSSLTFLGNAVQKADSNLCVVNGYTVSGLGYNSSHEYRYECYDTGSTGGVSFYTSVLWIVRITYIYLILYFSWEALKYFQVVVPK